MFNFVSWFANSIYNWVHTQYNSFFSIGSDYLVKAKFLSFVKAIDQGDIESVKAIIAGGFDLNIRNSEGNTVIQTFIKQRDYLAQNSKKITAILVDIIENTTLDINAQDPKGNTFLHLLCFNPQDIFGENLKKIVEVILSRRDYIDLPNQEGLLPSFAYLSLNRLMKNGPSSIDSELFKLLLSKIKDINFRDHDGKALIHYLANLAPITMINNNARIERHIKSLWNSILCYNPDLNFIDNNGNHVLDILEGTILTEILIKNGAKEIQIPKAEEIIRITQIIDSTPNIIKSLKNQSTLLYQKEKIERFEKYIKGELDQIDIEDKNLALQINLAREEYAQLKADLKKESEIFSEIEIHQIDSKDELVKLEEKLKDTHFIFVHRQKLSTYGKTTVHTCPKPRHDFRKFRALEIPSLYLRQLGLKLLPNQLEHELLDHPKSDLIFNGSSLSCHDLRKSDIPLLMHATNSSPENLKQTIRSNYSFLNDMVYISATYYVPGTRGFDYLKHEGGYFNVYLLLKVDPQSMFIFSDHNIGSPYSRRPANDPVQDMLIFLKNNIQENSLKSYIFYKLQTLGIIPMTSHTTNSFIHTGLMQLKSNTAEGGHNELIFVGNNFAKIPSQVVALAVDMNELESAKGKENYIKLIRVLNTSKLPVVLLDLSKKLMPNNRKPLCERLEKNKQVAIEQRKTLSEFFIKKQRLEDAEKPCPLSIKAKIEELKTAMEETYQQHIDLKDEGNSKCEHIHMRVFSN